MFHHINDIIYELSKGNKLNLMIFNGESLFVHSNYKNSLYYLEYDDSLLISTRPLSDEKWNALTINQLVRIKNGEILSRGVKHENEYVVTKENFNFIMESVNPDLRENILNNFGDLNYTKEYWTN